MGKHAIKSVTFEKKIEGPTLFSDEFDEVKPGWLFLHDKLFMPD